MTGSKATSSSPAGVPDPTPTPTFTVRVRDLVWAVESEIAVITNLCQKIDAEVTALNALRAEAAARLVRLDGLRSAADDADLEVFLETAIRVELPRVPEQFPDRLYGP